MKKRISGAFGLLAALVVAAVLVFLSAVLVPEAVHYAMQYAPPELVALLGPLDVVPVLGMASFAHLKRVDRGVDNLGGFVKLLIIAEDDFDTATGDWPKKSQLTTGECTVAPTLKASKNAARVVFDLNSGKGGSKRFGDLSFQGYNHELECQLAGYTKEQNAALDATLNMGAVCIGFRQDGTRVVFGSALCPMVVTDDTEFGAKGEDGMRTALKFASARALSFKPVILASSVVIAELA